MVIEKNFLLTDILYVLCALELKSSILKFPPVRMSVCVSECLVRGHNNFCTSLRIQTKFGGRFLYTKCSSCIEFQCKILILIKILILTKTLRNEAKFGEYPYYKKQFFSI